MLQVIDTQWKDHLLSMDHMKEGIGLRGYGQRDPLTEFKREAYDLFEGMVARVRAMVVELLFKLQMTREAPPVPRPVAAPRPATPIRPQSQPNNRGNQKVGRNEACPCGSGKKYKKCCLAKQG
jgi:preprotein translocase subunit SecA